MYELFVKIVWLRNEHLPLFKNEYNDTPSMNRCVQFNPNCLPCMKGCVQFNPNCLPSMNGCVQFNPNCLPSMNSTFSNHVKSFLWANMDLYIPYRHIYVWWEISPPSDWILIMYIFCSLLSLPFFKILKSGLLLVLYAFLKG